MYIMFNHDKIPIDLDEMIKMWRTLAEYYNIFLQNTETWESFAYDINSSLASNKEWFEDVFDKYF